MQYIELVNNKVHSYYWNDDLNCAILRPQGFKPDNPPHLCEEITKKAIMFTLNYLNSLNMITSL